MEQQVLDDIINRLLEVRGRPGKQVQLSESEIRQLCSASRDIFLQQPNLLDLQAPIKICGTTFFPIPTFCFSVLFSKFCFFWFLVWEIRCGFVLIGSFLGCLCGNFLQTQLCFCFFVFNFWFCLCLRCVSFDSVCVCLLLDSMKNFGWRSLKPTWGFGWLWFKVVWWNHSDVRVLVLIAVIGCDSFVLCIMIDWQWNYTVILWFMFWTVILCVWIWI